MIAGTYSEPSGTLNAMSTMIRRRTSAVPIAALFAGVASLLLLVQFALWSQRGQIWDQSAMTTVGASREAHLTLLSVLGRVSIGMIGAVLIVCVVGALLRGRVDLALGAVVLVTGANVTTQLLKHQILDRSDFGLGLANNSLPSGHTTVVASAVASIILVAPELLRSVLALAGAAAVTMTGASTVVAGWHRPADVIAALLVALIWLSIVTVAIDGRRALTQGDSIAALIGAGLAGTALVAVGVRPITGWDGLFDAAAVLGALAAGTAGYVAATCLVAPRDQP